MTGVLVLGALHYDVVVDAPRMPAVDETLPGTAVDYRFGGKGGNQAVAAARMGAAVTMVGRVGRDEAARTVLAALDSAGVDRSQVVATDAPTGMSVAITMPSGEYGAVIVSGANARNDGLVAWGVPPDIALLQNEIPESANLALVRRLPTSTRLVVNAAPARRLPDEIVSRADVLIVNRVEAEALTGQSRPTKAAALLAARVRGLVVLTLGAEGLVTVANGETRLHPAYPVTVVSTHGAGDMFAGALAARLTAGDMPMDALDFAQKAAALHVSSPIELRAMVDAAAVQRAF